jgi:hypothetical protein
MSKKFKGKLCAYCAEREAVTGDHIFARELFLPSARANLPQAPICQECNNEKSKLEHYLTTVLPFGGRHSASVESLASMVPKRLRKNAKLHRELAAGQQNVSTCAPSGEAVQTMTIPFDGERLERLVAMIARGLIWYHWQVYLRNDYAIQVHTVTRVGEQLYDELLFKRNARDRVHGNLGAGAFVYEGVQAVDDPGITAWRFSIYGGLASCEDPATPETMGSQIIVITGPKAAVLADGGSKVEAEPAAAQRVGDP